MNEHNHTSILQDLAHKAMLERDLLPEFSPAVIAEVDRMRAPTMAAGVPDHPTLPVRDLRHLLWSSIDNDDSRDLDQLSVAEALPGGKVRVWVAIADVDVVVKQGSAIDQHASHNTTSVYTVAEIFPMLPEEISTGLTSLNYKAERLAMVIEMLFDADGNLEASDLYRAWVYNHAKLAYNSVAAWLDGEGSAPTALAAVTGLDANLRLQDEIAQKIRTLRHKNGALSLETIASKPVFDGDQIQDLKVDERNRAKEIIENMMIAVNGVTARYLAAKQFPSIRRVVSIPKRWERIMDIAFEHGTRLPSEPDSKALEAFLLKEKSKDPVRFPDLSLSVIKLLGNGEYAIEFPDDVEQQGEAPGHFGLAVKDYSHSTAPNRRYPDLLTQRLLKAALAGQPVPYTKEELDALAAQCTKAEDDANKVERQVAKSAAALLLQSKIGQQFDGIVTGASAKGNWVRVFNPPVEGKLVETVDGVDVGDKVRVQLVGTNVERGFIDFKEVRALKRY